MSLSSLILRPEAGRYVIGAYLVFNALATAFLTGAFGIALPESDPIENFAYSFFLSSLMTTLLYYAGLHDWLLDRWLKKVENFLSTPLTPTLTEVSQLPFLQRSKDAFQGTKLLYYIFFLFAGGAIGGIFLLPDLPLPNKVGAIGSVILLSTPSLVWLYGKTFQRNEVYITQLLLSWHYFRLHLRLPEDQLASDRFRRLETQLGLGAWSIVRTTLEKYATDIERNLEAIRYNIPKMERFLDWCDQPPEDGPVPDIPNMGDYARKLTNFGFTFLSGGSVFLKVLERNHRELLALRTSMANQQTNRELLDVPTGEDGLMLKAARDFLKVLKPQVERELEAKHYRAGIDSPFD